ncbi:hypothetical protein ACWEGS_12040 [Streptomyces sp. NPDC004822]|uniref:hypothetical protein n=1 Tax=Streptomyces sp. KAU_LT TaxID=3046669 RepID=UPI0024B63DDC|nr:hypothetical protein [Streptomyces sp. KAU_LT]MDI9831705.1 hypothetical protein [Streptomyces sp. KAU_LT]
MSAAERHLKYLMRLISNQDDVELVTPASDRKSAGALVYVAECFGFRYSGVRLVGRYKNLHVRLVRSTDPADRQRAAANLAAFPGVGQGGNVPGMYQASLTPVPEAQADVALLNDLIMYDALVQAGNRRQLLGMAWASGGVLLLLALATAAYAVLLPLAVLMPAMLVGALRINAARRAKIAERLTAAGCARVQDDAGRDRYVRPVPQTG